MELEDTAGAKMQVHLKGIGMPDLAALEPELLESGTVTQFNPRCVLVAAIEPAIFAAVSTAWPTCARTCSGTIRSTVGCSCFATGLRRSSRYSCTTARILALPQTAFQRAISLVADGPTIADGSHTASRTLAAHQMQVLLSAGNPGSHAGGAGVAASGASRLEDVRPRRWSGGIAPNRSYLFPEPLLWFLPPSRVAAVVVRDTDVFIARRCGYHNANATDDHRAGYERAGRRLRHTEAKLDGKTTPCSRRWPRLTPI